MSLAFDYTQSSELCREFCDTLFDALDKLDSSGALTTLVQLEGGRRYEIAVEDGKISHQSERTHVAAKALLHRQGVGQAHYAEASTTQLSPEGAQALAQELFEALDFEAPSPLPEDWLGDPAPLKADWRGDDLDWVSSGPAYHLDCATSAWLGLAEAEIAARVELGLNIGGISHDGRALPFAIASSNGHFAHFAQSLGQIRLTPTLPGAMCFVQESPRRSDIDGAGLAREALALLERRREPLVDYPSAKLTQELDSYDMVFARPAVSQLLGPLLQAFVATEHIANRSPVAAYQGQQILPLSFNLSCDHAHPEHLGRPFDEEASPTQRVALVEAGVVGDFVYSRASARHFGLEPTGHGLDPLSGLESPLYPVLEGGEVQEVEELVAEVRDGILLHSVEIGPRHAWRGFRFPVTAPEGAWVIHRGELVGVTGALTIELDLLELFSRTVAMGRARRCYGMVVPPVLVRAIRPLFQVTRRLSSASSFGAHAGGKGIEK